MQHRNVLSQLRQWAFVGLGTVLFACSLSAAAQSSSPTLLSMLMPSLADTPAATPEDVLAVHEIATPPLPASTIDLTARPDNLWDRIRNGFAMTNLNDDLVLYYQQWYQNRPDALRRMIERSRPYLHHIVEELEARGMPTELALLPMVESAFNPNAYSRAHASGLWQFIPATGKRFNLEQNWWRDERRDVIASTGAALDYLQSIYDMHGDWHLALASYNWGEGAVKRAIVKNEARGLPTDYPNLSMPNETRHYVPKLQALKNILGDPVLMLRLGLPAIPNEPYFATLETRRPLDVKTAARLANMSLDEFQRLNPSHNRPIIKPDTSLVIPADKIDTFRNNLENSNTPLTQWQAYTLPAPERLDKIADRFDTTASELARANGLSEKVRLGAGSTLLVPGTGNAASLTSLLNADEPQHIIAPEPSVARCGKGKKAKPCNRPEGPATSQVAKNTRDAGKAARQTASRTTTGSRHASASTPIRKQETNNSRIATSKQTPSIKGASAKVAKSSNGRRS